MASLAGFIPKLAEQLGVKSSTLDERQKALVRAGLLAAKPGRGPGSGVKATPDSVAMMLISMLAPSGLAKTHLETKAIAKLKSRESSDSRQDWRPCPLTGQKTFGAAVSAILKDESIASRVHTVHVNQYGSDFWASLSYDGQGLSYFGPAPWLVPVSPIEKSITLLLSLNRLALDLKEHNK